MVVFVCCCLFFVFLVDAGGMNYLRAHIHLRFRHAHHETKDWLPNLGSRGCLVDGGGLLFCLVDFPVIFLIDIFLPSI